MNIKIDISDLDKNKEWWNNLSIKKRMDFLDKNGWVDINWGAYKYSKLHTALKLFINKKR